MPRARLLPTLVLLLAAGCGSSRKTSCDPAGQTGCDAGQVCEHVVGGPAACFEPVVLTGHVADLGSGAGLDGARVVALDVDGAPASSVVLSAGGADPGRYVLPVPAARAADGTPAAVGVTLRADRAGYRPFPDGLRTALPISLAGAVHAGGRWTVETAQTDVALRAEPGAAAGRIDGTVARPPSGAGVLVVAEAVASAAGHTALPGLDGSFSIFNLPDGDYQVRAYSAGVNYAPVAVTVAGGVATPASAALALATGAGAATATVRGAVQRVSTTFWDQTSVLLVVASTYDPARVRGAAPAGLKVAGVDGAWQLAGVPDGRYRVLAGFETDYLVRDPSDIGGTAVLEFQVVGGVPRAMGGEVLAGGDLGNFKVTGALRLRAPLADATGACAALAGLPANPSGLPPGACATATDPAIAWETYSSAKRYEVTVVGDDGVVAWRADVDKAAGGVAYGADTAADPNVLVTHVAAAALEPGRTYQVRVVPWDDVAGGVALSASEDLLGVFTRLDAP